jgi:two-component system chemotaxis response regulator CheY
MITRMKALIVDDDDAYLQLLRLILTRKQYQVVEAINGKDAWRILEKEAIPFVITDWMMPEMDGTDLIRRVRSANFTHYTYIILLTAKSGKDDVVDGLEAGADDYLTKPFDLSELRARIDIGERILGLETRLRDAMNQLYTLATRDSLTGIYNRRALCEWAEKEIDRTRREHAPISLIMVDVDHFKEVNDQYGHQAGDQALCQVVETISNRLRIYDAVGRWGGEEFLLVLPGADQEVAIQIAERLRAEIASDQLMLPGGPTIQVRASFGVAHASGHSRVTFDELIKQADEALYQAKNAGRNQVRIYSPRTESHT